MFTSKSRLITLRGYLQNDDIKAQVIFFILRVVNEIIEQKGEQTLLLYTLVEVQRSRK